VWRDLTVVFLLVSSGVAASVLVLGLEIGLHKLKRLLCSGVAS
jgi:hypothetical protein